MVNDPFWVFHIASLRPGVCRGSIKPSQGSLINCCGVTSNGLTSHQGESSNTPTL